MKALFNVAVLLLYCALSLGAQDRKYEAIYSSELDEVIFDAAALSQGRNLLVGHTVRNGKNEPLALLVDDSLNILNISSSFQLSKGSLQLIAQNNGNMFIFSEWETWKKNIAILVSRNGESATLIDSFEFPLTDISFRNYDTLDHFIYVVGDGLSKANPNRQNVFIIILDTRNFNFSYHEFNIPGVQFGYDIIGKKDHSFVLTTMGLPDSGILGSNKLCYIDSSFNITGSSEFPLSFYSNSTIIQYDNEKCLISGRKVVPLQTGEGDRQLFTGLFAFSGDSISFSDSLLLGKSTAAELEAFRGVSFDDRCIYYGGSSGFDAFTFPFTSMQNEYIITRLNKGMEKQYTKYFSLFQNHIIQYKTLQTKNKESVLLIGTAYDFVNNMNHKQRDIYIIRLDSSGNIATGLAEGILPEEEFMIYPNPGMDYLDISLPNAARGTFTLYDIRGRLLLERDFSQHLRIATGPLPAGIYIYRLRDERQRSYHGKWMKH